MQHWDPDRYARNAGFVAELGTPVLELLAPRPGEKILDLGCGDGVLTRQLVEAGADVTGIDSAPEQVAAARARGLVAHVGDGQSLDYDAVFHGILSNAALHWMKNSDAVIAGMWRALRPGGRVAAEMGGAGNVETIRAALIDGLNRLGLDGKAADPWYFPTARAYRAKLERAGFHVSSIEQIRRPTQLPGALAEWLWTFGESFLLRAPEDERARLIDNVVDQARPVLCQPDGTWIADYVRLRFLAVKPA